MNRSLAQAVVKSLSFTLESGNKGTCLEGLPERMWRRGLPWLDASGLTLYFWRQVKDTGWKEALPSVVRTVLARRQRDNFHRTVALVSELTNLLCLLGKVKRRYAVLKGPALLPDYCPDLALRLQFDHDFLLDRDSLECFDEILSDAGYRRKNVCERDRVEYAPPFPPSVGCSESLDFYSPRLPRSVELHLKLWDSAEEKISLTLPENFLSRASTRTWDGVAFPTLSEEDTLLFASLHAFRHILHNWCRLSVLFELAHCLQRRSAEEDFWQSFCARIDHEVRLRQIVGVVFTLAAGLFGAPYPPRGIPSAWFNLTPEIELWIARYGKRSALDNFSSNKFSLFLIREFVGDGASWREIRRQRLFPSHLSRGLRPAYTGRNVSMARGVYERVVWILRRIVFHSRTFAGYAWERPKWQRLVRRGKAPCRRLAHPGLAALRREEGEENRAGSVPTIRVSELDATRGGAWKSE